MQLKILENNIVDLIMLSAIVPFCQQFS